MENHWKNQNDMRNLWKCNLIWKIMGKKRKHDMEIAINDNGFPFVVIMMINRPRSCLENDGTLCLIGKSDGKNQRVHEFLSYLVHDKNEKEFVWTWMIIHKENSHERSEQLSMVCQENYPNLDKIPLKNTW